VTREFLLDYGDVGQFVDRARRFWLPFITYPAKALPLVGRQLRQHPGTFANLSMTMQELNQAAGSPDLSLLPVGSRSSFGVPVPFGSLLGGKPGQPMLYNPERVFSIGALNQFDPRQLKAEPAGLLNPVVKAAVELPTNYRLYSSRTAPRRQRAGALVQALAQNVPGVGSALGYGPKKDLYTGGQVPGYGSAADYILRLLPVFGQTSNILPAEGNEPWASNLASFLTGVRLVPNDIARQRYFAQRFGERR